MEGLRFDNSKYWIWELEIKKDFLQTRKQSEMRLITEVVRNTQRRAFHSGDLDIMRLSKQLEAYNTEPVHEHELKALLVNQLPMADKFQFLGKMPCPLQIQMCY